MKKFAALRPPAATLANTPAARPPGPATTEAELDAVFRALGDVTDGLQPIPLLPGEAARLGGWLSPMASSLVYAMANDLTYNAVLFPDVPVRGEDLRQQQRTAEAWLRVRDRLLYLAQQAADTGLRLQAEAVQTATRILDHVEACGARTFDAPDPRIHRQRLFALAPTINVRYRYRQKFEKARQRASKQRAEAAGAPPPPDKPPSRQRRAATAEQKAREQAEILAVFREHMARSAAAAAPAAPAPAAPAPAADASEEPACKLFTLATPDQEATTTAPRTEREPSRSGIMPRNPSPPRPPTANPAGGPFRVTGGGPGTTDGNGTDAGTDATAGSGTAGTGTTAGTTAAGAGTAGTGTGTTAGTAPPTIRPGADAWTSFLSRYAPTPPTEKNEPQATVAELQDEKTRTSIEFSEIPNLQLSEGVRERMAGKRYLEINEVAILLAEGLARHPDTEKSLGYSAAQIRELVGRDRGATTLAIGGLYFAEASRDGAILTGATLEGVIDQVVDKIEARRADPAISPQERGKLEVQVAPPMRMLFESRRAQQAIERKNARATETLSQRRDAALAAAADSRLIDSFMTSIVHKK